MPEASVSAVPDDGTIDAVLSVLVKATATPGSALPLPSFTSALTIAERWGDTELAAAPEASTTLSASGAIAAGAPGAALAPHEGRFGSRVGSRMVHAPPGPPLLPPQALIAIAMMQADVQVAARLVIVLICAPRMVY
ncbi:hypothetical protein [Massilia cavernae]|uniref:hypothetical protein n=1 Tax=Massilia cavernae TaxID=2320864 RepID=UPI001C7244B2|nr:hypothetical protein [Massilia cavernae]